MPGGQVFVNNPPKREHNVDELVRNVEAEKAAAAKGKELKEEMDDLLDEIDSLLEENAQEFVTAYVQKGGE